MSEVDRICRQMQRASEGEAWHGPSLLEILGGVTAEVAAARPIPDAHSIWEILLHLTATQELVLARLQGVPKTLSPEEDWPVVSEPTEEAWREAVEEQKRSEERLRERIASFPDERLGEPLVPRGSSAYDNFHGIVQHNLYHAGQMVLLKKMATAT